MNTNKIVYLEQPTRSLDNWWIVVGGTHEEEFKMEFETAEKAWQYYFHNRTN
jgi:hypothetical protein